MLTAAWEFKGVCPRWQKKFCHIDILFFL